LIADLGEFRTLYEGVSIRAPRRGGCPFASTANAPGAGIATPRPSQWLWQNRGEQVGSIDRIICMLQRRIVDHFLIGETNTLDYNDLTVMSNIDAIATTPHRAMIMLIDRSIDILSFIRVLCRR
jgi:hypothetical protein